MIVENTMLIEAPAQVVWNVTTDIERWPEWTPTVKSVVRLEEQPLGLGSRARIKQPGQPESLWTVTAFEPEKRFVWETRRPGLQMKAAHELFAQGRQTHNLLRVEVTGLLGALFWPVLRWALPRALSQENRGLKARCEGL